MRTNKTLAILAFTLGALLPFAAQADGLDYSYLDLDYAHIKPDSATGIDAGNGYALEGSYSLPANFVVFGDYSHAQFDLRSPFANVTGITETDNGFGAGLGYHYALVADRLDLVGSVAYSSSHSNIDVPRLWWQNRSDTETGYNVELGLRGLVTDWLELQGALAHSHVGDSANGVSVGAIFHVAQHVALGLDYGRVNSNGYTTSDYGAFLRFMF